MRDAVDHGLLLIAAPKTNGTLPVDSLGGTGIFTAILVAIYCVEMMRFLKAHNIGIRLPDQVPPMIKNSFDLLIPVLVVVLTLYPLSLFIQHHFDMLIPQAIMAIFKPLVSAADSLPAILLAVLIGHLLWFAGIHGAAIVSGMLQMFWLTNLGMNQQALARARLCRIFLWRRSGPSLSWSEVPVPPWGWCSAICAAAQRICAPLGV